MSGEGTSWSYGAQVSGEGVCGYLMELWSTGEWRGGRYVGTSWSYGARGEYVGTSTHGVMEHR